MMNKQAKTTIAFPAPGVLGGFCTSSEKCPTLANTIKHTNIQIPPVIKLFLRPKCSITYNPPNVVPKFTPPRIICVTYVLLIPAPLNTTVP